MTTPGSTNHIGNIKDVKATGELGVPLNLLAGKPRELMVHRSRTMHPKLCVN